MKASHRRPCSVAEIRRIVVEIALTGLAAAAAVSLAFHAVAAPAAAPAVGATVLFGENMHPARYDQTSDPQVVKDFRLAAATGATTVRADVDWSTLQPTNRGSYAPGYVKRLDSMFAAAHRHQLKVIVVLLSSPCWDAAAPAHLAAGCSGSADGAYPPSNDLAYAHVAAWLVRHFHANMAALEVWNEPDYVGVGSDFISNQPAKTYTALLRATYPIVKLADPAMPVLGGSFMNVDISFLQRMLSDGAAGSFDGLSLHMYDLDEGKGTWTTAAASHTYDFERLPQLEQVLTAHRVEAPIWVTELGYYTCGTVIRDGAGSGCISPHDARVGLRGIVPALASLGYVHDIELYELVNDAGVAKTEPSFGLYTRGWRPRPIARAVRPIFASLGKTS